MKYMAISQALGANWFFYYPDRVLFDCGEGVGHFLDSRIFAIEKVFITHGHMDHNAGLFRLICMRNTIRGDRKKPLTVYYPEGDFIMDKYVAFIDSLGLRLQYKLEWVKLNPDDEIPLHNDRLMRAFRTNHVDVPSLGYLVFRPVRKLKEEFASLPPEECRALMASEDSEKLFYTLEDRIFCYPGDTAPMDAAPFKGVHTLVQEATFIKPEDRKRMEHCTLHEAIQIAKDAQVQRLILNHFSPRYQDQEQIEQLVEKLDSENSFDVSAIRNCDVFTE